MRCFLCAIVVACFTAAIAATPASAKAPDRSDAGAETYEHLASTIIDIRKTEDSLVAEILNNYRQLADDHLRAAEAGDKDKVGHLEAAAEEVTYIANEGNKRVQAVRQRLLKAGHSHHSDADTKEDYMYVNSAAKKDLLALAKKIGQLGSNATADQVTGARKELDTLFTKVMSSK